MGEYIATTIDGPIAEVSFIRPEIMNAWTHQTHEELDSAFHELQYCHDVRAVVIGSSGPVFSAGGNFDYLAECGRDRELLFRGIEHARAIVQNLIDLKVPVIAAVQGPAVGGAANLVLNCDIIVAARSATLLDPHVVVGLGAGDGGCVAWPIAAGMMIAKRYLLTGDALSAEDAHRMGVITDLVDEPDDVLPAARRIASRLAALPPLAVQGTKRSLNNVVKARAAEVLDLALAAEQRSVLSDDFLEAIAAAKEHRRGNYTGR